MSDLDARQRSILIKELYDELYDQVNTHGTMAGMTVAEIIGTLELLKHDIMIDQSDTMDGNEDEEDLS